MIVRAFLVVAIIILAGCTRQPGSFSNEITPMPLTPKQTARSHEARITTSTGTYTLKIADTPEERQAGLSNYDEIPQSGMLFVLDDTSETSIWMKDMLRSIDIVWLRDGIVVDLVENVSPQHGVPDSELTIYRPSQPADTIIEVMAGTAQDKGLGLGSRIEVTGISPKAPQP
jgi:uncharacterized membrane protein (UPF0127 family)